MKSIIIYYSFEGNTKLIAESMQEAVGGDIVQIKMKKEVSTKGIKKFLWGGKKVIFKEKPEIYPDNIDLKDYDLVFIGTPVWAGKFSPAFTTLFSNTQLEGKSIAFFCCYMASEGKTFKELKELLKDNKFVGEIGFKEPSKNSKKENIEKAKEWAINIVNCNKKGNADNL